MTDPVLAARARRRGPSFDGRRRTTAGVLLLFLALTLLLTYPLSLHPADTSLPLGPDGNLFMWTLAWDAHAFIHQPLSIFDANIYHPERNTLAYSENLIGSALVAAPILWLTGNPVLALNVTALLSCLLCGIGAYVLARRLGLSQSAAVLCGLVFAFSPPRFFRTGQLHLGAVQWIPFALASAHAYLDDGRRRDLRLTAAFVTLQALSSGHGIVFLGFALALLALYRIGTGERLDLVRRVRDLGITGTLLLLPAVLVFLPYRRVQQEMGLRRTLENWAIDPASFLAAPTHVQTWVVSWFSQQSRLIVDAQAFLFPGYVPLLLAAGFLFWPATRGHDTVLRARLVWVRARAMLPGLLELVVLSGLVTSIVVAATGSIRIRSGDWVLFSAREPLRPLVTAGLALAARLVILRWFPWSPAARWRLARDAWRVWAGRNRQSVGVFYGLLTFLTLLLSVGPPLGLWPLIYWLPGLNFIRVPSRFTILGMLGLAVLAGAGFDRLSARLSSRRRLAWAAGAGLMMVVEFAAMPLATVPADLRIPAADQWLSTRPGRFAIVEFPVPDPSNAGASARLNSTYMLHSMAHWQKTVHGHSGFQPPFHDMLYRQLQRFPDEDTIRLLAETGVRYIIVHAELYAPAHWTALRERMDRSIHLRLEHVAGEGRVYSLAEHHAGRARDFK
ncbi:MAG: hypothetical protein AB1806_02515 [Acidobacteriota bacterium]